MALAKNLKPSKLDGIRSKIKIPKLTKPVVIGLAVFAIVVGTFGAIYLARVIPKSENRKEIKFETGDQPLPKTTPIWVTADGGLVMREGPDKNSKQLLLVPTGTKLEATELNGEWYKVNYQGKDGWVNKNYVTQTAPAEDPTKNWNTFANKNFGYTVRYPKEWVAQDYGANPATNSQSYVGFGPQLAAVLNPTMLPPAIIRVTADPKEKAENIYKTASNSVAEAVTVSGLPGTKYTYKSCNCYN